MYPKAPLNDPKACASLMGLKPSTTKSHLIRAILESVAFRWETWKRSFYRSFSSCLSILPPHTLLILSRNKQLYDTTLRETHIPITKIRCTFFPWCSNSYIFLQISRHWIWNVNKIEINIPNKWNIKTILPLYPNQCGMIQCVTYNNGGNVHVLSIF